MPVSVRDFRKDQGADLKKARESIRKRGDDEKVVDTILDLDSKWRKGTFRLDQLRKEMNATGKQIGKLKKAKQDASELIKKIPGLKTEIRSLESKVVEWKEERDKAIASVGNWLHDSVPEGETDKTVRTWGGAKELEGEGDEGRKGSLELRDGKICSHDELLRRIRGFDPRSGKAVSGVRGYFLTGPGALLNHALQAYAIRFLTKRGYVPVQPPVMMKKDVMAKVAQLSTFDEDLYKVVGGKEDMYLAATSEQPLCAMHANENIEQSSLPKLYAGISTCFRKELTSHGVDAAGVFRVHQFEKVEQFAVTSPHDSWKVFERFITTAEKFYQSLGIPYRVVNIGSKSLSKAASKKYDLEGWFPSQGTYRELVSCSNCTDYQSRALNIRYGFKKLGIAHTTKRSEFVHLVNATLCASQRTLSCLLETHQTPAGIRVPDPLVMYVGTSFIPFDKREVPEEAKSLPVHHAERRGKKKETGP